METSMIIYKTTNLINGKIYIGKDTKNNPLYLGSGLLLQQAIKKYGTHSFKKDILELCTIDNINEREIFWIQHFNATDRAIGYNLTIGGSGGDTFTLNPNKQQMVDKLILASTGRKHTDEAKSKISHARTGIGNGKFGKPAWNRGISPSQEIRDKISLSNKGKILGIKRTQVQKDAVSQAQSGKPKSTEHKQKIAQSLKGRKREPEVIEKTAAKLRGKKQPNVICPHCNKVGAYVAMQRWHFSNCKQKKDD